MIKQTAVEWLIKKLQNRQNGIFDGLPHLSLDEIYNQAKQMAKEQIIDAILNNQNGLLRRKTIIEAEQYYNETYNKH